MKNLKKGLFILVFALMVFIPASVFALEAVEVDKIDITGVKTDFEAGDKVTFTAQVPDFVENATEMWILANDADDEGYIVATSNDGANDWFEENEFEATPFTEFDETGYSYQMYIVLKDGYVFATDDEDQYDVAVTIDGEAIDSADINIIS